jgi:nucleoside-diphosphate-sugar epimerase
MNESNGLKILITGAGGYVGSQLVPALLELGYHVIALDTFWYGIHVFDELIPNENLKIVHEDLRNTQNLMHYLKGVQVVIHLACISNDPSFDMDPKLGKSINLDSFHPLVLAAKESGVERFIYASSSSVYGVKEEQKVTEDLTLEPLTDYSRFKMQCEEILLSETSGSFIGTILRPATVCGFSIRQRFDLSVNILTNHAITNSQVLVFGGSQHRPNIHIEDMVRAYLSVIEAPISKVQNEIFNVGIDNLSIDEIAQIVSKVTNVSQIKHLPTDDLRSYRIDSSKIITMLNFKFRFTVEDAVKDLVAKFQMNAFSDPLNNPRYFNIKRMKELKIS